MKLVLQAPYPTACELACIAMICDVDLETVIRVAGTSGREGLDFHRHQAIHKHFGMKLIDGCVTAGYGAGCLGAMMRKHPTLIASLVSCTDIQYAHAIVLHEGHCYDPHAGMDPSYPWDRYIARVSAYEVGARE